MATTVDIVREPVVKFVSLLLSRGAVLGGADDAANVSSRLGESHLLFVTKLIDLIEADPYYYGRIDGYVDGGPTTRPVRERKRVALLEIVAKPMCPI